MDILIFGGAFNTHTRTNTDCKGFLLNHITMATDNFLLGAFICFFLSYKEHIFVIHWLFSFFLVTFLMLFSFIHFSFNKNNTHTHTHIEQLKNLLTPTQRNPAYRLWIISYVFLYFFYYLSGSYFYDYFTMPPRCCQDLTCRHKNTS